MKPSTHRISILFAVALITITAAAQQLVQARPIVPRLVSYSGRTFDGQRRPVPGAVGVTFAIYRDEEGGAPLWLETQTVRADVKGDYTVELGATKTEGLPLDLFSSRESRWLGVTISGQEEQRRVLLLSVPYALKAADSETLGGLPASAFMLAASVPRGTSSPGESGATSASSTPALGVEGTGTPGFLSQWTATNAIGNSVIFQSGTGSTVRIGINTSSPLATLNVKGTTMMQGSATMASAGVASASAGTKSYPLDLRASAYSSSTQSAANQNFQWVAEPSGNNTSSPSASLNLLFGQGSTNPAETGLKIASNGQITFAPGQTFPGSGGTVTSVGLSAPSEFTVTGSPVSGSGTLTLNWKTQPNANAVPNAIVERDANGSMAANVGLFRSLSATTTTSDGPVMNAYNSLPTGTAISAFGDWAIATDNNVHQGLQANGWVKAMVVYDDVYANTMLRCFNSTLHGSAATTPPCGFTTSFVRTGTYTVDFGFDVSNRFVLVNALFNDGQDPPIANSLQGGGTYAHQVSVEINGIRSGGPVNGIFSVFIF